MTAMQLNAAKLYDDVGSTVETLEHLAVEAAYLGEPCAQILLRTAELLRATVLPAGMVPSSEGQVAWHERDADQPAL
ncbi:hypothetical protein HMPREF9946_02179 [Acetobacteraceae bacterium AT-5844]|nr:hypothetical protein HMPREF9946_02179 [Acetobacteraceae bacterium AT-5844]